MKKGYLVFVAGIIIQLVFSYHNIALNGAVEIGYKF